MSKCDEFNKLLTLSNAINKKKIIQASKLVLKLCFSSDMSKRVALKITAEGLCELEVQNISRQQRPKQSIAIRRSERVRRQSIVIRRSERIRKITDRNLLPLPEEPKNKRRRMKKRKKEVEAREAPIRKFFKKKVADLGETRRNLKKKKVADLVDELEVPARKSGNKKKRSVEAEPESAVRGNLKKKMKKRPLESDQIEKLEVPARKSGNKKKRSLEAEPESAEPESPERGNLKKKMKKHYAESANITSEPSDIALKSNTLNVSLSTLSTGQRLNTDRFRSRSAATRSFSEQNIEIDPINDDIDSFSEQSFDIDPIHDESFSAGREEIDMQNSTVNDATTSQVFEQHGVASTAIAKACTLRTENPKKKKHIAPLTAAPEAKDTHKQRHRITKKQCLVEPEPNDTHQERHRRKKKLPSISNDDPTSPVNHLSDTVHEPENIDVQNDGPTSPVNHLSDTVHEPENIDVQNYGPTSPVNHLSDTVHEPENIDVQNHGPTSPVNHLSDTVHVPENIDVQNVEPKKKNSVEPSLHDEPTSTSGTVHVPYVAQETDMSDSEQELDKSESELETSDTESNRDECRGIELLVPELSADIVEADELFFEVQIKGKYILDTMSETPYVSRFIKSLNIHFSFPSDYEEWKCRYWGDSKFLRDYIDLELKDLLLSSYLIFEPGLSEIFCVPITFFLNNLLDGANTKQVINGINMILEASESKHKLVEVYDVDTILYAIKPT